MAIQVGGSSAPMTPLEGMGGSIENSTERLRRLISFIDRISDQLLGPIPEVAGKSHELHGVPTSMCDKLEALRQTIDRLEVSFRRLDSNF